MIGKIKKLIKGERFMPFYSMMLIMVAFLLALFAFFNDSLGWIASNDRVASEGMTVSVSGLPDADVYLMIDGVRVDASAADLFSDLTPGQKVSFKICVKNTTDGKISFRISMPAPTAEQDTVFVADGLYHYFGSQIRINSIKNGSLDVLALSAADCYLLPLDEALYSDGLPPTALDAEYDFSLLEERNLTGEVVIDANAETFLDVELEFVDNNTLQNAYIDFGKSDGQTLSRTLICYLSYA